MAPDELLRVLEGAGLHLTAQDGVLTVHPKSALTEESRELIRAHKTALIELLSHQPAPPEDLSPHCRKSTSRRFLCELPSLAPARKPWPLRLRRRWSGSSAASPELQR